MPRKSRGEIMDFYRKRGDEIRKSGREPSITDADPRDLLRMVELDRSPLPEEKTAENVPTARVEVYFADWSEASRKAMRELDMAVRETPGAAPITKIDVDKLKTKPMLKINGQQVMVRSVPMFVRYERELAVDHIVGAVGKDNLKSFIAPVRQRKGEEKKAEVSKAELKHVLKNHEERETPAQEAAESKEEQAIEERAGMHEKSAFWSGFEKQAGAGEAIMAGGHGAMLGATVGSTIAAVVGGKKAKKFMTEVRTSKDRADAKKEFAKLKPVLPKNTVLLTRGDLNKIIPKEMDMDKQMILQSLRDASENGNAAALHESKVPEFLKKRLPSVIVGKNVIFADDKVSPTVLYHEAGHLIDFEAEKNKSFLPRILSKLRSTYKIEQEAWKQAPGKINEDLKDQALGTYAWAHYGPRVGALLGGAAGVALGAMAGRKGA